MSRRSINGVKLCKNGCNKPCCYDRRVCYDCRPTEQREYQRRLAKQRRNPNFFSESCNCGNSTCTGLTCDRMTA